MEFENYEEYKQYVYEMWSEGYINELEMDGMVIPEPEFIGIDGFKTINNRLLTEQEYNKKYGKE